tara:strand:- start:3 stop:251 length:249 start_codon:yes stop_codon:yes gene_type:complete
MAKIYIDNSSYMEFIDEIATQMTELNFHEDTFRSVQSDGDGGVEYMFTDDAQDFYNERYDEVETMLNKTLNIHSNNELINDN